MLEGWCENCQTCKIAKLQFRSVSPSVTTISARDASASEKMMMMVMVVVTMTIMTRLSEIHLWIDQLVQISRDIANQLHHRLQQVAHLGLFSSELKKANLDMAISQHQPL